MKYVPSVGRIVHFVLREVHRAAIITHVWTDACVNLYVFPTGIIIDGTEPVTMTSIPFTTPEDAQDYTCHWPEKTEAKVETK